MMLKIHVTKNVTCKNMCSAPIFHTCFDVHFSHMLSQWMPPTSNIVSQIALQFRAIIIFWSLKLIPHIQVKSIFTVVLYEIMVDSQNSYILFNLAVLQDQTHEVLSISHRFPCRVV